MRPINEERLRSTLEFIRQYQISEGRTPTYREIKEGCGYSSLGSVSADINRLKERGLIEDDNTTGWNRIKIPNNLQSQGTHNTLIVGAVPCGQPTPAIEDIEAAVALPDAIFGCADHVILRAKGQLRDVQKKIKQINELVFRMKKWIDAFEDLGDKLSDLIKEKGNEVFVHVQDRIDIHFKTKDLYERALLEIQKTIASAK